MTGKKRPAPAVPSHLGTKAATVPGTRHRPAEPGRRGFAQQKPQAPAKANRGCCRPGKAQSGVQSGCSGPKANHLLPARMQWLWGFFCFLPTIVCVSPFCSTVGTKASARGRALQLPLGQALPPAQGTGQPMASSGAGVTLHPQTCHGPAPLGATSWLHPRGDTAAGQLCLGAEGEGAAFWGREMLHRHPWVRDTPVPRIPRQPHPDRAAGMCAQETSEVSSAPLVPGAACPGWGSCWPPASTSGQIRSGANEQPPPGAKAGKPAARGQAGRALLAVGSGLVLLPQDPWGGRAASRGRYPTQ